MQQDEFDLKIKQDFISEALEMLGWVEDQFLIFEQNPNDRKVVDEIFRMAHTVKGSALTCGFLHLGEFAHVMETLLVKIREGKHSPDSETVDVLLRANDTLRIYLELLRNDFDARLDTASMQEDLMYFIGGEPSSSIAPSASFGFFDDDEPSSPPPPTPSPTASLAPDTEGAKSRGPGHPIDELSYLSLKAYLELSSDSSPSGVEACLRTLESALAQLTAVRHN